MEKNVVILDIDYVTYENKPVIRLFSKDKDKNIVLLDDTFEPYLYVAPKDDDLHRRLEYRLEADGAAGACKES